MTIEQAFKYLQDAPHIVKTLAPMSWQYISAPRDGSMWLEWISDKSDQSYPSDGYIWADVERTFPPQDYNGYTIEVKMQTTGYRPGHDALASHARSRYRFMGKNPSVQAPHPDPSLWIVHYHRSSQNPPIHVNQIPTSPSMQQVVMQRRWLESQGALERREFMLHDRSKWPVLNLPGAAQMQQPGVYGANAMAAAQNRFPQPQQMQQPPNVNPHKRPRTQAPHPLPGASDGLPDTTIEDEENTALGDFFDHLSQRDISQARYMQHHRWMDEVFSSPYATSQIVPTDLGLGLMGELKGLTDGILAPPDVNLGERAENQASQPAESQPFTNVTKEQVDKFSKRVEKHLEEGKAEIERMKAEHAARMQGWKKVKALTQAEKRLRYATWRGHEEAVPAFRLDPTNANGSPEEGAGKEFVEDIVKEVEQMLNAKIEAHEDCTQIARGGLKERKLPTDKPPSAQGTSPDNLNGLDQKQQPPSAQPSGVISSSQAVPAATVGSSENGAAGATTSQAGPNQNQHTGASGQSEHDTSNGSNTMGTELDNLPDLDMNDALMDGMDIDESNLDFDDLPNDGLSDEPTGTTPSHPTGTQASVPGNSHTNQTTDTSSAAVTATAMGPQVGDETGASTGAGGVSSGSGLDEDTLGDATGDPNMFNDTFEDLANLGGGDDDDGLIDFDGGGMEMEDSAFGDALHGMETPDGEGGSGTPVVHDL